MIFVTLGSQKFQFNRLLQYIDEIIERNNLKSQIFAQIGASDYTPQSFKYVDYLSRNEFKKKMNDTDILLTHAGTGAIVTGLKSGKYVIAVPRQKKFNEHVDNHQFEIAQVFQSMGLIQVANTEDDLEKCLDLIDKGKIQKKKFISNTHKYVSFIQEKCGN